MVVEAGEGREHALYNPILCLAVSLFTLYFATNTITKPTLFSILRSLNTSMANLCALLLVWAALYEISLGRVLDSHSFVVERDVADRRTVNGVSSLRKRQDGTGELSGALGKSLYWFGNFSVGDSGYLRLLIDTGSSDLWLNTGVYVNVCTMLPKTH